MDMDLNERQIAEFLQTDPTMSQQEPMIEDPFSNTSNAELPKMLTDEKKIASAEERQDEQLKKQEENGKNKEGYAMQSESFIEYENGQSFGQQSTSQSQMESLSMPTYTPTSKHIEEMKIPQIQTGKQQFVTPELASASSSNELMMSNPNEPRRRSTRDIKRPKFDDELVESIHKSTPKRRQSHEKGAVSSSVSTPQEDEYSHSRHVSGQGRKKGIANKNINEEVNPPVQQSQSNNSTDGTPTVQSIKQSRKRKLDASDTAVKTPKVRKSQSQAGHPPGDDTPAHKAALKASQSHVEWTAEDDIALIAAVTHVYDLWIVHSQMQFTKRYTLDQIEERWYELLYDEQASRLARKRMEQLSKERMLAIQERIPFSMAEEQLISQIPSSIQSTMLLFHLERLLDQHRDTFHHARTVKALDEHWRALKRAGLLTDQHFGYSEEDNLTYDLNSIVANSDGPAEQLPLDVEERNFTRNVAIAERETKEWEGVVVGTIHGVMATAQQMNSETVGMLCGRCITFDIRREKVLIGRSTKRHNVEINLTLEGPTARISRKQAIFKLAESGDCLLRNIGRKHISVNGRILLEGEATKLTNNAMIEIGQISLKFQKNENYRRKNANEGSAPPMSNVAAH